MSICEAIAKAIRLGKFALIRPVTTFTDGSLRRQHQVDAGRARLLGEPDDRVLDVPALAHHQVGQLVDDDHDVGHPVGGVDARLVVGGDVAGRRAGEPPVAVLHLADGPLQGGLRLVGLRDHGHLQVRACRCTPPSSTRLRSMRMSRTSSGAARISRLVMSALTMTLLPEPVAPAMSRCGIFAEVDRCGPCPATSRPRAKVSFEVELRHLGVLGDPPEGDHVEVAVGDLDADDALARDRRLDADACGPRGPSPGRRRGPRSGRP